MVNITSQVCSEVYDIIHHMEMYNKIPKGFIELMNKNRDLQYKVNIDYSKSINDQELQKGTRVLLSLIYRDYLCSESERKALLEKDQQELKQIETELNEKYNQDNLFKNRKYQNEAEKDSQTDIIVYKETIFQKIINKIKKWFHLK